MRTVVCLLSIACMALAYQAWTLRAQVEKYAPLSCGVRVQYEDLSVAPETDDDARWRCYRALGRD